MRIPAQNSLLALKLHKTTHSKEDGSHDQTRPFDSARQHSSHIGASSDEDDAIADGSGDQERHLYNA